MNASRSNGKRCRLRGQGLVEFAMVGFIFFALVFGVLEFARLAWTMHELENGTREAMRYAVVRGADSGAVVTGADSTMQDKFSRVPGTVNVNCSGCGGYPGSTLTVTSQATFSFITFELLGVDSSLTLNASSTGTIHH